LSEFDDLISGRGVLRGSLFLGPDANELSEQSEAFDVGRPSDAKAGFGMGISVLDRLSA
jgi:hypothetical protein